MINFPIAFCPADSRQFYAQAGAVALDWNLRLRDYPHSVPPPDLLNKHYEILALVSAHAGAGVGAVAVGVDAKLKYIEDVLKQLEKLYIDTFNKKGGFTGRDFYQKRRAIYAKLDMGFNRLILAIRTDAHSSYSMNKTLGVSSKSTVHHWRNLGASPGSVPGLSPHLSRIQSLGKVVQRVGYVAIALDGFNSYAAIQQACDSWTADPDPMCRRTQFEEGGRLSGSVIGGIGGGFLSTYLVCNVATAIPSAGTSLLWCGIVAAPVGGFYGSRYLGRFGKERGSILYESRNTGR